MTGKIINTLGKWALYYLLFIATLLKEVECRSSKGDYCIFSKDGRERFRATFIVWPKIAWLNNMCEYPVKKTTDGYEIWRLTSGSKILARLSYDTLQPITILHSISSIKLLLRISSKPRFDYIHSKEFWLPPVF
jgi:hypothetical protein